MIKCEAGSASHFCSGTGSNPLAVQWIDRPASLTWKTFQFHFSDRFLCTTGGRRSFLLPTMTYSRRPSRTARQLCRGVGHRRPRISSWEAGRPIVEERQGVDLIWIWLPQSDSISERAFPPAHRLFRISRLLKGSLIPLPDHFEYAATPSPLSNYRSPGLDSIQTDLGSAWRNIKVRATNRNPSDLLFFRISGGGQIPLFRRLWTVAVQAVVHSRRFRLLKIPSGVISPFQNRYNATTAVVQGLAALFQSVTWPLCSGCQTARKCLCRRHCSVVAV
jgi:hypothetical protein